MPFPFKTSEPARIKRNDPWTGQPIISGPASEPDVEPDPFIRTDDFARIERVDAVNARLAERGRIAEGVLRREFDKYANDSTCHPVRRLRLRYKRGPLSREDASVLSGVPVRTIARIEDGEGGVGDLAYHALAVAFQVPRQAVQPGAVIS